MDIEVYIKADRSWRPVVRHNDAESWLQNYLAQGRGNFASYKDGLTFVSDARRAGWNVECSADG